MRRRSRAGGQPAKTRNRKTVKRRPAPKSVRRPSLAAGHETIAGRLTRERDEALEQQRATAEVLKIISASPTELQAVLEVVVRSAARFCEADDVTLFELDGQDLRQAAHWGPVPHLEGLRFPCTRGSVAGRVILERKPIHVIDLQVEAEDFPEGSAMAKRFGHRTIASVPLLREGVAVGTFQLRRTEVKPFTEKQIALLGTFADQAVIAIENARLLNELRQSLEQQTATSEVLSVISSSPGELKPVFQAMLANAVRICEAKFGTLYRFEGNAFHWVAQVGAPLEFAKFLRQRGPFQPPPGTMLDQVLRTKEVRHTADETAEAVLGPSAQLGGARSVVAVPMLKDDALIGAIVIYRQEIQPFTDKQIELVKNFAAQAVIAIENTRLLNELRESLQQRTATAEVLKIIAGAQGELQPVFETMLAKATELCGASYGALWLCVDDGFRYAALHGELPKIWTDHLRNGTVIRVGPDVPLARLTQTQRPVQIPDMRTDSSYLNGDPLPVAGVDIGGIRTLALVPMIKNNSLVGAIAIYRKEVRPFAEKEIELLSNFAAQAVIAIENARLLNELRESLERQTATADVLRVISSSPGELKPVFQSMLENATRICEAKFGNMLLLEGDVFRHVALHGASPEFSAERQRDPIIRPKRGAILDRLLKTRQAVQVVDVLTEGGTDSSAIVTLAGARTILMVPMLKHDDLIGGLGIYRQEVRPFTDKQVELVSNFAAQAVIAIENTRLLNELRQSLQQQTATADVLKLISRSTFDLQAVLNTLTESAARLCAAEMAFVSRREGDGFRYVTAVGSTPETTADAIRYQKTVLEGRRFVIGRDTMTGRVLIEGRALQIADLASDTEYKIPESLTVAKARTLLGVPLMREAEPIGVMSLARQRVEPFTEQQIELVKTFADQAVIAIENSRLLNELRQRTSDLTESLEQQTATSKVLEVISRSAFDLQAVFETVAESSLRLCGADRAFIYRSDGGLLRTVVAFNAPQELKDFISQNPIRLGRDSASGRAALERRTIHIPDLLADPEYSYVPQDVEKIRTVLSVPIIKGDDLLGVINIYRLDAVAPFADKQITLVETFADQAAIAIDNVRLLDELRQSLEQQTATADMLKLISRSTFDLKSVLNTLVESAARLCEADITTISREKDGHYHVVAAYGFPPGLQDYYETMPMDQGRGSLFGRILLERKPVQIADVLADPEYAMRGLQKRAGFRTVLGVPLLREGVPIGLLSVNRTTVRPFTDKQIEVVTAFADQAAIAIENVRLFDEIQDKSRQLEIASQHKSQFLANMSHELRTPLNAILGYTELMADGAYGEPSEKMLGILKRLEANGRHLLGLINDVLDLSKIEAGQLVLELSDYSVQDIAQTVRSTLEPLAADKKLAFKVEVAPQLPPGRGDGRRLTQVLINLVGNAIKFTDAGEVAIKAEANNGSFHVFVRDTGPGISAADQAKLFQEFQQADNAITRKKGGTGLGLAISKRIIEMHGGRIWVESQVGRGSTFTFTLPVVVEQQVNPEPK
jgi:GAF domain-containing protein